jgi:hypothetical protein
LFQNRQNYFLKKADLSVTSLFERNNRDFMRLSYSNMTIYANVYLIHGII